MSISDKTIPDLMAFFMATSIHKDLDGQSNQCDESLAFIKNYVEKHFGGQFHDIPAHDWIEKVMNDETLPTIYRKGLEGYVGNYRSLLFVLGRDGIEDAGEYAVKIGREDGSVKTVDFTDIDEARAWVESQLDIIMGDDIMDHVDILTTKEMYIEEINKTITVGQSIELDELGEYAKGHKFTVASEKPDLFSVECLRDEVAANVELALQAQRSHYRSKYKMIKRLRPKGDKTWGNWWREVKLK